MWSLLVGVGDERMFAIRVDIPADGVKPFGLLPNWLETTEPERREKLRRSPLREIMRWRGLEPPRP
jgi:hypothetical protein